MEFKDVKIVKKCNSQKKVPKEESKEKCKSFDFEGQNFLKTVEKDILYIDDSIKIGSDEDTQPIQESLPTCSDCRESDFPEKCKQLSGQTPPACFDEIPKKLHEQMSLPINNIKDLSFYETFIISQNPNNFELSDIEVETDIEDTNEIGSACLMIEELSNGCILIFSVQQMFIDGERTIYESLSVVTKDLKLVHEKRIERKCSDSEFMVCSFSMMIKCDVEG